MHWVLGHRPAGIMDFEEAKAKAITLYQNYLEQQWVNSLKERYPATINEKALDYLFR